MRSWLDAKYVGLMHLIMHLIEYGDHPSSIFSTSTICDHGRGVFGFHLF